MKTLIAFALLAVSSTAHATVDFPNDTMTQLYGKGNDCGFLNLSSAYFTEYDQYGSAGTAVVFHLVVKNDAYDKSITIKDHATGVTRSVAFNNTIANDDITALFAYSADGYDRFTILDKLNAAHNHYGLYDFTATMNGSTYTCSNVLVRIKEE